MYLAAVISFSGAGLYLGLGYFVVAFAFGILGTGIFISRDIFIEMFKSKKAVA